MCSQVVDKAGHRAHSRRGCTRIKTTTKKSRLSDGAWPLGMSCLPRYEPLLEAGYGYKSRAWVEEPGGCAAEIPPPPTYQPCGLRGDDLISPSLSLLSVKWAP